MAREKDTIALSDEHNSRGIELADRGWLDEAIKELQISIDLDPSDAFPRHELAALHMDEGDYRQAITQLKEVVRLEPDNFEAQLDLGICYAQKGFYAEAERAYDKARALSGDDLLLNYNFAALYALWGKKPDSLEYLKRSLALERQKVLGWLATDPMF